MNSLSLGRFALLVGCLFSLLAVLWLSDIGKRKLANPDEGRYSVLAMHMADSGDYVTPRLNGLKYFEKPPMQYWATAAAIKSFGKSEWSARLYTALAGLLTVLLVSFTAGRLFTREVGVFTGLALVACPYFMALAEIVTLDMGLTFWTTLTVCAFMLSQHNPASRPTPDREQLIWLYVAAIASAGAVLSKGLIGIVFPGVVLFLYCLFNFDWPRLLRINWWIAVPLFLLVVCPWFVLVAERNPEFMRFFFIHEHFQRFTTTQHRRVEAWWFFLPILFVGVLAWAFLLVPSMVSAWHRESTSTLHPDGSHSPSSRPFRPLRFALIWSVFIIFFFSISGSKLPAYILPTFPFFAMLIGYYLAYTPGRKIAWYVLPIPPISLIIGYVLQALPVEKARNAFELGLYTEYSEIMVAAFIVFAVGTAIAVACFWRNTKVSRRWGVAAVAAASVFMVQRIDSGYETLSPLQSGYGLAQSIGQQLTKETRLYSVNTYDQTLAFYLGRYTTLVDYVDEFEMGQKSEPGRSIARLEDFPSVWKQPGPVIAIIPPQDIDKMRGLGLEFEVIHESPRRFAIMKR
jgi:4-amino-4-deoxy-L-arabinose transferase-like glycosyltransferase